MSDIPSECVWGLKIMQNWQKTLAVWAETTELVAAFERERKGGVTPPANPESPKRQACGTFQDCGSRGPGRASPQLAAGSFNAPYL